MSSFPFFGVEFVFYAVLESRATPGRAQSNPTVTASDFTVSKDGAAESPLSNLPVVLPAGGRRVRVTLSALEMQADSVHVIAEDVAGDEWFTAEFPIVPDRLPAGEAAAGTLTATEFDTTLTAATNDYYNDLYIHWDTGPNAGLSRKITGYDGVTNVGRVTVTDPLPFAPTAGDRFTILGRSE